MDKNDLYKELLPEDLIQISGGRFAYDAGFFLREMVIYIANGGGIAGTSAAAADLGLYYQPLK